MSVRESLLIQFRTLSHTDISMREFIHSIPNSLLYATAKISLSGAIWIGMSPQTDTYLGIRYTFRTQ